MPATKKLTIAALVAVIVFVAGCNSKHASSADTSTAAAGAAAATSAATGAGAGAGAGASTPTNSGASGTAACPLTGAQVTAVMGATYADPTVAYGICSYLSSDNAFTIIVNSATGAFDFTGTLATAKQDQGTDTSTTIPGLGDKAAGTGQEIVVQSGGKTIDIRSADAGPSDGWPKSIALAKLVIVGLH